MSSDFWTRIVNLFSLDSFKLVYELSCFLLLPLSPVHIYSEF
jgi:hypothetical protein